MLPSPERVKASTAHRRSAAERGLCGACRRAALPGVRLLAPSVRGKVTEIRRQEEGGGEAERMAAKRGTLLESLGGQVFSVRFFHTPKIEFLNKDQRVMLKC